MKKLFKLLIINFLLFIVHCSLFTAFAQYTKLLDFNGSNGRIPYGSLISDGTYFYGMTWGGGTTDNGVVFKIKPDGTGYTKLLDFNLANGANPRGSLFYDGTWLFGMADLGGANGDGVIFKIKPDGTGYTNLHDFNYTNGAYPLGSLISVGNYLYGMTKRGGANNDGIIFKIKPDGSGFTVLFDFNGANGNSPDGSLIFDGTFLYGMTGGGGNTSFGYGVIFKIKPDGTGFKILLNFNDGHNPDGSLFYDGNFLFGTTDNGGNKGHGIIFKIKPDGTGYTKLFDFNGANGDSPDGTLIYNGTYFFGMTYFGGINNRGVVFRIKPDGTGFDLLLEFNGLKGDGPSGDLISDGNYLYGMTTVGGTNKYGVIFKLSSCIPVTITKNPSDTSVCNSGTANFSVTATGDTAISYQWQLSPAWTNITDGGSNPAYSGANTPELTVSNPLADSLQYRCIVSNCSPPNFITSNPVTLSIAQPLSLNTVFKNKWLFPGDSLVINLNQSCSGTNPDPVSGTGPFTYQWYLNGNKINGATNSIYNNTSVTGDDEGLYTCVVSNSCYSATDTITDLNVLINNRTRHTISGSVIYDNKDQTPLKSNPLLNNVYAFLYSSADSLLDSTLVDECGVYHFSRLVNDDYFVTASTSKPWRQCTPANALMVNRNYIGLYSITDSLKFKAADVNADTKINPADALMINRRYIGIIKKFKISDWLFEKYKVEIVSIDVIQNIRSICTGDVNGSYIPK